MICTQDKDHLEPAVLMADLGYHLLLEKPMAVDEEDCRKITEACTRLVFIHLNNKEKLSLLLMFFHSSVL